MALYSTCRRRSTGARRHHCSDWHSALVESYQLARLDQLARAEAATAGYASELAAYWRDVEAPLLFRDWLTWHRHDAAPAQ